MFPNGVFGAVLEHEGHFAGMFPSLSGTMSEKINHASKWDTRPENIFWYFLTTFDLPESCH